MISESTLRTVSGSTAWESLAVHAALASTTRTVCEVDAHFYPMWRQEYLKVGHTEGKVHVRDIAISGTQDARRPVNSVEKQLLFFRKLANFIGDFVGDPTDRADLARAVHDAVRFVVNWPRNLPLPAAAASECGELAFHWSTGNRKAIVRFEGDGAYGYALMSNGRYDSGQVDVESSTEIPKDLKEYLSLDHGNRALP